MILTLLIYPRCEVEAKRDMVKRHELRHDRHKVLFMTDYMVFSPIGEGSEKFHSLIVDAGSTSQK
jgi:hypothetical protein